MGPLKFQLHVARICLICTLLTHLFNQARLYISYWPLKPRSVRNLSWVRWCKKPARISWWLSCFSSMHSIGKNRIQGARFMLPWPDFFFLSSPFSKLPTAPFFFNVSDMINRTFFFSFLVSHQFLLNPHRWKCKAVKFSSFSISLILNIISNFPGLEKTGQGCFLSFTNTMRALWVSIQEKVNAALPPLQHY